MNIPPDSPTAFNRFQPLSTTKIKKNKFTPGPMSLIKIRPKNFVLHPACARDEGEQHFAPLSAGALAKGKRRQINSVGRNPSCAFPFAPAESELGF
jgi:hypothetical protein